MTCHNLAHFYPTKQEILFMFSCKSKRNFLVVFLEPQLTATKVTRTMQLQDSVNSPTSTTHMVSVQLNGTATTPKMSKMTYVALRNRRKMQTLLSTKAAYNNLHASTCEVLALEKV